MRLYIVSGQLMYHHFILKSIHLKNAYENVDFSQFDCILNLRMWKYISVTIDPVYFLNGSGGKNFFDAE